MTILRDGEKYACKQCIQGHRVSTCTHEERPLLHVARKGRPVSQCTHCRGLRKSRATHVRCECGERRHSASASHSRHNSSESATFTGDEAPGCQCYLGKKCTCAHKKDAESYSTNLHVPRPTLEPFFDRQSGKPRIPNRRSESSVPRPRSMYQPSLHRSGVSSQDFSAPYQTHSSPLTRGYHTAQRSVDSLPLFLNGGMASAGQQTYPPAAFQGTNFVDPRPQMTDNAQYHMSPESTTLPGVPSFGNFNVEPLADNVLERTLSPRNPNRHSIAGWPMSMYADLQNMVQQQNAEHTLGDNNGSQQGFPFPATDAGQWPGFPQYTQHRPPTQAMAGTTDLNVPWQASHSRSSSGTVSEPLDPPSYSSNHPTIHIDPSWTFPNPDQKEWSASIASYQDLPQDFNFPGDAMLQNYQTDDLSSIANYSEFGDTRNPAHPMNPMRHDSLESIPPQSLPDRSVAQWQNHGGNALPNFKFPPDPSPNYDQTQPTYADDDVGQYDWQANQKNEYGF